MTWLFSVIFNTDILHNLHSSWMQRIQTSLKLIDKQVHTICKQTALVMKPAKCFADCQNYIVFIFLGWCIVHNAIWDEACGTVDEELVPNTLLSSFLLVMLCLIRANWKKKILGYFMLGYSLLGISKLRQKISILLKDFKKKVQLACHIIVLTAFQQCELL